MGHSVFWEGDLPRGVSGEAFQLNLRKGIWAQGAWRKAAIAGASKEEIRQVGFTALVRFCIPISSLLFSSGRSLVSLIRQRKATSKIALPCCTTVRGMLVSNEFLAVIQSSFKKKRFGNLDSGTDGVHRIRVIDWGQPASKSWTQQGTKKNVCLPHFLLVNISGASGWPL